MSNHQITMADALLRGNASFEPHKALYDGRRGHVAQMPFWMNFAAVAAVVAGALVNGATTNNLPNAGTVTFTPLTDGTLPLNSGSRPAVTTVQDTTGAQRLAYVVPTPRNVVLIATHGSSLVAMTLLVQGLDVYKQPMSELLSVTATGTTKTVTGKKAFAYITSYSFVSAGNAQANTANLAYGNALGLPYRVAEAGAVLATGNGALETTAVTTVADDTSPATNATGDVRGTYTPSSSPDGTKRYSLWMVPTDPQTAQPLGLFGNPQV